MSASRTVRAARTCRVVVLGAMLVGAVTLGLSGVAAAAPHVRVGPDQTFRALVDGRSGRAAPVAIQMACFGPLQPGQTGHPLPGQHVEVLLGPASAAHGGFTGANGTSIGAFFGAPPPAGAPAAGYIDLTRYGVAKVIPTSLVLPCAGSGQVIFVPLPMSPPTSRDVVVAITYVGQP